MPSAFEVIMDLLIESWEWSLGLSIAFGVMMFIGFKIGWLFGYVAVEGTKPANAPMPHLANSSFIDDVGTPQSDL